MKYLVLGYGAEEDWNALTAAEQEALLAADEVLRQRGSLVAAVRPTPTVVRSPDGTPVVTHGSFARPPVPLAGFGIIEAADLDEVIGLVANTPCARAGGAVEIHPVWAMNEDALRIA